METRIIPVILIVTVAFLGLWGVGFMNHDAIHACPVSVSSGGVCPPNSNAFSLITHHVSGMQNITKALVALAVFVFFAIFIFFRNILAYLRFISERLYYARTSNIEPRIKYIRWFVLHNNLNPPASFRV